MIMENAVIFIQSTEIKNWWKFTAVCALYISNVANQQSSQNTEEHKSKLEDENIFSSKGTHHMLPWTDEEWCFLDRV